MSGSDSPYCMLPTSGWSLGSTVMVRLTPSASAGHSAALAVAMPSRDASRTDAATVLRMPPFYPDLDQL